MDADKRSPVIVIGVGNWYRGDDGVGLVVARKIKSTNLPGVVVHEESGEGAALMEAWKDADRVIIIDATSSGSTPGTINTLNAGLTTIPSTFFHYSSHAFSVAEGIELARLLNRLPPQLIVYGIEGKNFLAGIGLSPELESASEEVVGILTEKLGTSAPV